MMYGKYLNGESGDDDNMALRDEFREGNGSEWPTESRLGKGLKKIQIKKEGLEPKKRSKNTP